MNPVIAGGLIQAGGALLGGIFGRKSARDQQAAAAAQYERELAEAKLERETRIQTLVADAKKAGINPLTALRSNGGSQGYNVTHGGLTSSAFLAEAIGEAGRAIGGAVAANDPMNRRRQELELKLLERDLAAAQGGFGYGQPGTVQPRARNAPLSRRETGVVTPVPNAMEFRPNLSFGAITDSPQVGGHDAADFTPGVTSIQGAPLAEVRTAPNGRNVTTFVGPDLDEMITGAAMVAWANARDWYDRWLYSNSVEGVRQANIARTRPRMRPNPPLNSDYTVRSGWEFPW